MKAKIENSIIKLYALLPSKYRSATLNVAGGFDKMSTAVHEAEGFYDVVVPAYNTITQKLGTIYFDAGNGYFTYPVEALVLPSLAEAQASKLSELKTAVRGLYNIVQMYITEKQIHDETIPTGAKDIIKDIRTKYLNIKGQIEATTTVVEALTFALPYEAIAAKEAELEALY